MVKRCFQYCLLIFSLSIVIACKSDSKKETHCRNGVTINFIIKTETADKIVYLTGNTEELGAWRPDGLVVSMENKQGTFHFCTPRHEVIEFKITAGTWNKEAIYKKGALPKNFRLIPQQDTTVYIHIDSWKDELDLDNSGMTGDFDVYKDQSQVGIIDRDVTVWLPPGYDENVNQTYPVVYLQDGQNVFNPATSTNGVDWGADEWADSLIRNQLIEPIILVAINCSDDRYFDYSPGKKGQAYMGFISNTLKHKIDSTYRTKIDVSNTAVVGASMGGLISFMLHWEHNDVFGKAACLSPAFVYRDYNYPMFINNYSGVRKNLEVYISNGTKGLEKELQAGCNDMIQVLDEKGYSYQWYLDEGAEHNEAAWNGRLGEIFIWMFGK